MLSYTGGGKLCYQKPFILKNQGNRLVKINNVKIVTKNIIFLKFLNYAILNNLRGLYNEL